MRSLYEFLFLTLVLVALSSTLVSSSAFAAKETPSPDLNEPEQQKEPATHVDEFTRQSVDIVVPPPIDRLALQREETAYFHPYRYGLTVYIGQLTDTAATNISDNSSSTPQMAGVQYLWRAKSGVNYEAGADLFTDGTGSLQIARRYIMGQDAFRPYWKWGVGLWINPPDQLAAFVNFGHLRLLGAGGFEYHLFGHSSVRLEVEGGFGPPTSTALPVQLAGRLGWVWSW